MDKAQAVGERCGQGAERDIECMAWALPHCRALPRLLVAFCPGWPPEAFWDCELPFAPGTRC